MVLGGSIAGLLAARVLTETHAEVVIVDRDPLGPGPGRAAAPHRHATSTGCSRVATTCSRSCSPGSRSSSSRRALRWATCSPNARVCIGGYRFRQGTSGLTAVCVSRPILEVHDPPPGPRPPQDPPPGRPGRRRLGHRTGPPTGGGGRVIVAPTGARRSGWTLTSSSTPPAAAPACRSGSRPPGTARRLGSASTSAWVLEPPVPARPGCPG